MAKVDKKSLFLLLSIKKSQSEDFLDMVLCKNPSAANSTRQRDSV